MKKIILNSLILLSVALAWSGCKDDNYGNYPGGNVSSFIPMFDLRNLYKGSDVSLTNPVMFGSDSIRGIVVSDHTSGNLPSGLLIVQDRLRLGQLRGIAIPVGTEAAKYVSGDSVHVKIAGGLLKRVDGILQVLNISAGDVKKKGSNRPIAANRVPSSFILTDPGKYESTLVSIVKGTYNPPLAPTDVLSGDKTLNDGFENITLHTEASATFANVKPPFSGNYTGIVMLKSSTDGKLVPQIRLRNATDITTLSSTVDVPEMVITGYIADVIGGDGNYEYVQFKATKNIDFAVTPFSLVTTNNAGASTPATYPVTGWALGGLRTFKFNLTSGTVAKGEFFYVGGAGKLINGASSTSMASSKWIRSFNYTTTDGDGFGTKNGGIFANSGNASGMAVFRGTNVVESSQPIDVIWIATGGLLYQAGPPAYGYRVGNTDLYDAIDPITLKPQPFYRQGTNTISFIYTTADLGYFNQLGGIFDTTLGKWVKARTQKSFTLTKTSPLSAIENAESTEIK
ncbi:DUF5689 domain-containing protein [Pedobacter frigiditerrae]|uniref:DUF5689 domain-containing protein n=1 Tax=Pedobacter frigiditerrae TaxID=2530452 RepID=UPI00292F502A|nr:DUF5689 domain-containing protein [Pedobacter frigiditerrae]